MTYLLVATAILWSIVTLAALSATWAVRRLPSRDQLGTHAEIRPRVSVIITARDEAEHIEASLRGFLTQAHLDLDLIAVDDRSTDDTGAIIDRLADEDDRITPVHVDELPDGWLGKCHACHQGAQRAAGQWLLFTDADTKLASPDVLFRSIATAERDGADHMAIWPSVQTRGPLSRGAIFAWQASMSAYAPPALINHDLGSRAMGIGAYNLVRASAYREIGGHEVLRMEVVDDMKLGLLVRRAGFRQRVYKGIDEVITSWGGSAKQMIQILEKNWFAAVGFNLIFALAVVLVISGTWLIGISGPIWDPIYGWIALASVLSIVLPSLIEARLYRWPYYTALFAPLGNVIFVIAAINSIYKTMRQGGIYWRETFYPIDELRRGVVK